MLQKDSERSTDTTEKSSYLTHLRAVGQPRSNMVPSSPTTLHGVILPRINASPSLNPLTTPISTLALLTWITIHILAILLSSDHPIFGLKYLLETENSPVRQAVLRSAILIPPSFLGLLVVLIVVTLACLLSWYGNGRQIWRYSEQWVLTRPKAFMADDEPQREVGKSGIDEKATMLVSVDVEDVVEVEA